MKFLPHILAVALLLPASASAAIYVKIPGFTGDSRLPAPYNDGKWFVADSFSFGVEREISDSVKGGTQDINIGVGELQECTISKSMDQASAKLMQAAITGSTPGTAEIHFVQVGGGGAGGGKPVAYLKYKLDRCFVKSWSTSGDADDRPTEEVAFYYNKIAFQYSHTEDAGTTYTDGGYAGWDNVTQKKWTSAESGLQPAKP